MRIKSTAELSRLYPDLEILRKQLENHLFLTYSKTESEYKSKADKIINRIQTYRDRRKYMK